MRRDAGLECMLNHGHLGHGVGQSDDLRGAAASGQYHMHMGRTAAQSVQHIVQRHPAVNQREGDFVQRDHEVLTALDDRLGLLQAIARKKHFHTPKIFTFLARPCKRKARPNAEAFLPLP